jgi:hypothetical protein
MTAAIFGLIGVIVGGVLQGRAAWHMERHRQDWAARRAGRLLARAFGRCRFILGFAHKQGGTWGILGSEIREALAAWPEHASTLAGTIEVNEQWFDIVGAVEHLERIAQRAEAGPTDSIDDDTREYLAGVAEIVWGAAFIASLIGVAGIKGRRRTPKAWHQLWSKIRRRDPEEDLEDRVRRVVAYSYEVDGDAPSEASEPE